MRNLGLIIFLISVQASTTFAQSKEVHPLVLANKIENKLRAKGFVVLGHYKNGYVPVAHNFRKSFADSNGTLISTIDYTNVRDFAGGFAAVQRSDAWTLIDTKGEELFPPKNEFSNIELVQNGRMVVRSKKENKAGIANITGAMMMPFKYDFIRPLDSISGNYCAIINGGYELLDSVGNKLSENSYEDITGEECSTAYAAQLGGRYGILDLDGRPITTFGLPYPFIQEFSHELALVRKDDKIGFIDINGDLKISFLFDDGFSFNQFGNASVRIGEDHAMIDSLGNVFLRGPYDLVMQLDSNLFRIVDFAKQYVVNRVGKKVWPDYYYLIEPLERDLYKVIPLTKKRKPYFADERGIKIADYGE